MIVLPELEAVPGVVHGFFGRQGGVSQGIYASLNCGFGSGDDPQAVAENRARVAARLGLTATAITTLHQEHSARCVETTAPWPRGAAPRADAQITAGAGLGLGALAADCVPVLFAERAGRMVAAAHAGWRGALDGVLDATVAAFAARGVAAAALVAGIGPCIRQDSYEVGPEFPAPFLERAPEDADLFRPADRSGHHLFDLAGYCARRLARLGVGVIADCGLDTLSTPEALFSYRGARRAGHDDYGRNLSVIARRP